MAARISNEGRFRYFKYLRRLRALDRREAAAALKIRSERLRRTKAAAEAARVPQRLLQVPLEALWDPAAEPGRKGPAAALLGRRADGEEPRKEPKFDRSPLWRAVLAECKGPEPRQRHLAQLQRFNVEPPAPVAARLLDALLTKPDPVRDPQLLDTAQRYLLRVSEERFGRMRMQDVPFLARSLLLAPTDCPGLQQSVEERLAGALGAARGIYLWEAANAAVSVAESSPACRFITEMDAPLARLLTAEPVANDGRHTALHVARLCRALLAARAPAPELARVALQQLTDGPELFVQPEWRLWVLALALRSGARDVEDLWMEDELLGAVLAAPKSNAAAAVTMELLGRGVDLAPLEPATATAPALASVLSVELDSKRLRRLCRQQHADQQLPAIAAAAKLGRPANEQVWDALALLRRPREVAEGVGLVRRLAPRDGSTRSRVREAVQRLAPLVPVMRAYEVVRVAELALAPLSEGVEGDDEDIRPLWRAVWGDALERSARYSLEERKRLGVVGVSSPSPPPPPRLPSR